MPLQQDLADFEDQIFSCLGKKHQRHSVLLKHDTEKSIWTLHIPHETSNKIPLVMLHGFGAGIGLWLKNLPELSTDRSLYAFDLPGFGRSFRVKNQSFKKAEEAEEFFVDAIEDWRIQVKLKNFIILGHSFGGYLASAYALKYPDHVRGIVLVDAWGFMKQIPREMSRTKKLGLSVYKKVCPNPLSLLRAVGSWGPSLINRVRPDIVQKYQHSQLNVGVIANYVYLCNALEPSGEMAFKSMSGELGSAQRPMIERVAYIQTSIPIAMLNGKQSWVDHGVCQKVKDIREKSLVHIELINEAGHHVYADQPDLFNQLVSKVCLKFEDTSTNICANKLLHRPSSNNNEDNLRANNDNSNLSVQLDKNDSVHSYTNGSVHSDTNGSVQLDTNGRVHSDTNGSEQLDTNGSVHSDTNGSVQLDTNGIVQLDTNCSVNKEVKDDKLLNLKN